MAFTNKVTSLRNDPLNDEKIQVHLDEQNALGFRLIALDNLVGWYRFFWEKEET
jgi:hypothetical protein